MDSSLEIQELRPKPGGHPQPREDRWRIAVSAGGADLLSHLRPS